jgi:predicted DCC family thiol-disulfide oxidoreductase YuxK
MGAVVLFDGVCHLCHASVRFIIARDKAGYFSFASLQSDVASELLRQHGVPYPLGSGDDSVILIEDGVVYTHSDASLRVARRLSGVVRLGAVLLVVPKGLRDAVYRLIARNRYRWFGKDEVCWMPTPELRARFLDA